MPGFRRVSREEASGRRRAVNPAVARLKQYQGYIKKVNAGETGRLKPGKGETPAAVRRRLGAAAKALGVRLTVKRVADQVFFWR